MSIEGKLLDLVNKFNSAKTETQENKVIEKMIKLGVGNDLCFYVYPHREIIDDTMWAVEFLAASVPCMRGFWLNNCVKRKEAYAWLKSFGVAQKNIYCVHKENGEKKGEK